MGVEWLEIGVKVRKGVMFTIRGCFRSVRNHPLLVGFPVLEITVQKRSVENLESRWQEVMVLSAGSLVALELEVEGELPDKVSCYQGVFYNYFSIGLHLNISFFRWLYSYLLL
ncbi:hypothetical protein ACS0TY_029791 [Phlomoides rotata]